MKRREKKLVLVAIVFAASIVTMLILAFTGTGGEEVEWFLMLLFGGGFGLLGDWFFDLIMDLKTKKKEVITEQSAED